MGPRQRNAEAATPGQTAAATGRTRGRRPAAGARTLVPAVLLAGLLSAVFPLATGDQPSHTLPAVLAAAVAAMASTAIMPLAFASAHPRSSERRSSAHGMPVLSAALVSAGAAAIHFSVAKMHFDEYTLFGVFFVASGIAQLGWGFWVAVRPHRALLLAGAVGNALIVGLWIMSRTAGVPIGPEHWKPEAIGFADVAATGFELVLVVVCIGLLARGEPRRRRELDVDWRLVAALSLAVVVLTTLGLLSAVGVASSFIAPSA